MNFKKVEMVGFKSFADPVKIEFDSGITAIVGPNGCGKSNVADAIRWVLGEQSSKNLRGTSMQDVIFKGTEKRKSLSFSEVSLHFDNTSKIFKTEYDEIVLTRKLYRSGDSEYLINNVQCRLKDIVDLLHDSGIGKSGYSIIGQGKVDEIINSRPIDRRAIFEEAAGIAKFKFKKIEAERRLGRTQENLVRINDLLNEVGRQLKPLRHQSEVAKKYLELKEVLKSLEVNAYIYQYDSAAENKAAIQTKINAILEELSIRQKSLDDAVKKHSDTFEEINDIDNQMSELNNQVLNLTVGLEKFAGEQNLIKERVNNLTKEELRLVNEIDKLTINGTEFAVQLEDKTKAKAKLLKDLEHSNNEVEEVEKSFNSIASELQASENEAQETQKVIFEKLSKLGDVKAQISALKAEKTAYEQQLQSIAETKKDVESRFKVSSENYNNSKKIADSLEKEKLKLEKLLETKVNEQNNLLNSLKEVESTINSTSNNIISLEQRKKMFEDMQKEYEGYYGSVKRLLMDVEKNADLKKNVVGVLASLIKVPQQFETAIETALGSAVQNIVTVSDEGAKQLVNYLKQKDYGRATFLPVNTIKPRYLNDGLLSIVNKSGAYGVASDLIEYNGNISNIISSLLGSTVIVNDINEAVELAKTSRYSFRIVTLDGDVINPQGSISGGSKKAQVANLLSRENNIKEISQNINKLKSEYNNLLSQQKELSELTESTNNEVKLLNAKFRESEIGYVAEFERLNKFNQISQDLEQEVNKSESQLAKTEQIIEMLSNELLKLTSNDSQIDVKSENIDSSYSKFDELRKQRDKFSALLTNLKIENANISTQLISTDSEIERLKFAIKNNNSILEEYENNKEKISGQLDQLKKSINAKQESDISLEDRIALEKAKEQLKEISGTKLSLQADLRKLEQQRAELQTEVSRLNDRKYQQELGLAKIDTDIEALEERVSLEYDLDYESSQQYKVEEFDLKQALTDITRLRREINGLGNVNVNAIEELKLLEERHGTMFDEATDLIKAENDLKEIIKDLSNEMIIRFEEEFNKINKNFGIVFKELFGGGSAKLELQESEDVLEAGVDIIAEPPGKKLSNIALLSGGEKALTAIAILFAILRLRPMPFCLLDEIEAPLDEANVVRFASYLKRYSNETQFIVITHKKATMEFADSLYGVTMEEKGVSKIVSVKLNEAVKVIEN